ncbi:MAG: adaptor protein MecA [Ruminococcus sp.]|nr:adaptor protein MecA [Ruminococcus sp.]
MTVNRLSGNRVLIILGKRDLDDYALNFARMDENDADAMRVLSSLSRSACRRHGIAVSGRQLRVEALSLGADCYLLVTVGAVRRKFRNSTGAVCYRFSSAGDLLDCIAQLLRSGFVPPRSSLYTLGGAYYLVFSYPALPLHTRVLLSEYNAVRCRRLTAAYLAEHASLLCHRHAVAVVGKALR